MENKNPKITKTILYNEGTPGAIIILAFKLYYRAIVIKPYCIGIEKDWLISGKGANMAEGLRVKD